MSKLIDMKKQILLLLMCGLSVLTFAQSTPYGTKIFNNLHIVRGADTIWIQQDGSYAHFYATDSIKFNTPTIVVNGFSTTQSTGDNTTHIATTAFVQQELTASGALPSVVGQDYKLLTNDGASAYWSDTLGADFYMDWNEIHDVKMVGDSVSWSYGSYIYGQDQFGNDQNMFRLNPDNSIGLGTNLAISGFYTLPNHRGSWFDIGIDSDADYGDVVGISGYIGGDKQIDIRGQADGAGGLIDGSDYIWVKAIYDSNGNALHESVTGDSQLTDIKAKYILEYARIVETNGGTVTVQLGTTAGASDVFTATAISANSAELIQCPYGAPTTSGVELYISDTGGGWGTAELTVYLMFRRYAE